MSSPSSAGTSSMVTAGMDAATRQPKSDASKSVIARVPLILVRLVWQPVGGDLYDAAGWRAVAHAAVQLAGLALIAQSVRTIDPLELAGIRPSSGGDGLQVRGPYRLVRHPLDLGWILAAFGAGHMTGDRFAFA